MYFPTNTAPSKFNFGHRAILGFSSNLENNTQIWEHQKEATLNIFNYFENPSNRIGLCVLPTGAGKSGIAVLSAYVLNATRVLIITPSETISNQLYHDFCDIDGGSFLVRTNAIANENPNQYFKNSLRPSCKGVIKKGSQVKEAFTFELVIANAHKFRPLEREEGDELIIFDLPNNIDLVIVDEAHHYPAKTWYNIINHFTNAKKLFLTATPYYKNGDILTDPNNRNFQENCTCYSISRETLIDRRIIRPAVFDQTIADFNNLPTDTAFEHACKVIFIF